MKISDLTKRMQGVFIVILTPFQENGDIDFGGLRANLQYLKESTEDRDFVLIPTGSTGEFYALNDLERREVLKVTKEELGEGSMLFAGTANAGTRSTVELTTYAESIGYDGAQIVLPYYHTPSEEGMFNHYKSINEAVGPEFGIQVYNNPFVSGCWIKPHLMTRISKLNNVIADKENSPDIRQVKAIHQALDPDDMRVVIGLGEAMYQFAFMFGVRGFTSGIANFAPHLSYSLYEASISDDLAGVREAMDKIDRINEIRERANIKYGPTTAIAGNRSFLDLSVLKAGLDLIGLCGGRIRAPITEIQDEDAAELKEVLKDIGLPVVK